METDQPSSKQSHAFFGSFGPALRLFSRNDPMRMAGATAFFTTFALPPIIFLLAQLFGFFSVNHNMARGLLENISGMLGKEGAEPLRHVLKSIRGFGNSWYVIAAGLLFLFFVATTLFIVIKNSLNQIWQICVDERPGWFFFVRIRLRSFAVILLVGVLFLADISLDSLEVIAGSYIESVWKGGGNYFRTFFSQIVSILIVSTWFVAIFRFLGDCRPPWKAALLGGLLTGVLFSLGRIVLGVLLVDSNMGHLYGASGALVLILLFVFYSSFILYYGACFISVYSAKKEWLIKPANKAYIITSEPLMTEK